MLFASGPFDNACHLGVHTRSARAPYACGQWASLDCAARAPEEPPARRSRAKRNPPGSPALVRPGSAEEPAAVAASRCPASALDNQPSRRCATTAFPAGACSVLMQYHSLQSAAAPTQLQYTCATQSLQTGNGEVTCMRSAHADAY